MRLDTQSKTSHRVEKVESRSVLINRFGLVATPGDIQEHIPLNRPQAFKKHAG
ncbi:MAG: hypothetical protein ACHBN1_02375 [Heteroscytonema crispum UTEX LB 1556]